MTTEELLETLETPAYVEVLLCVATGKNYASSIARHLKKKQPTVTEQLAKLESLGLIVPLKRDKAKKYEVNWPVLLKVFYDVVKEAIECSKDFLLIEKEMMALKDLTIKDLKSSSTRSR